MLQLEQFQDFPWVFLALLFHFGILKSSPSGDYFLFVFFGFRDFECGWGCDAKRRCPRCAGVGVLEILCVIWICAGEIWHATAKRTVVFRRLLDDDLRPVPGAQAGLCSIRLGSGAFRLVGRAL